MNTNPVNVLEAKDVCVSYDGKANVISDVNLEIESNECFGLIGLNGVGKTTFIKTILGLRSPTTGSVKVCGVRSDLSASNKAISFLPERFDPPWFMTGYEFIQFSLDLYKKKFEKSKVDALADKLSLNKDFLNKKAQQYSKGMRQKLGLIATILAESPLLILDEPMSGLDPKARRQVKNILLECKANGQTILICSHILSDIRELCDNVGIVNGATLAFKGTPDELLRVTGQDNLEEAFIAKIEAA